MCHTLLPLIGGVVELLLRIQRRRNDQKVKQEGEAGEEEEEAVIEEPRDDCESAPRSLSVWRDAGSSEQRRRDRPAPASLPAHSSGTAECPKAWPCLISRGSLATVNQPCYLCPCNDRDIGHPHTHTSVFQG